MAHVTMMTSSNGNIFNVAGPLCGEFTVHWFVPTQKPVTRSFDIFFDIQELLHFHVTLKCTSWVKYFMWNFKGYLWNCTQNMFPIHWDIRFWYSIEILRALGYQISSMFVETPPRSLRLAWWSLVQDRVPFLLKRWTRWMVLNCARAFRKCRMRGTGIRMRILPALVLFEGIPWKIHWRIQENIFCAVQHCELIRTH